MNYIHSEPQSSKAKAYKRILKMIGANRKLLLELETGIFLNKKPAHLKRDYFTEFNIKKWEVLGRNVIEIGPLNRAPVASVLYLHGGAYIHNILRVHWNLITNLVASTGAKFIVPDYPLAPEAKYQQVYEMVERVYQQMAHETGPGALFAMGDSAGGGLALGLMQKLRDQGFPTLAPLILLSPWLDITLSDPTIDQVAGHDILLKVEGLVKAGEAYRGEADPRNPLVSPLYGSLNNLGTISMFTSTEDVLVADSRKLRDLLDQQNLPFNYFEYPGMFHGWMAVVSLPEAKSVLAQIKELIT